MSLAAVDLIETFGRAAEFGNATLFVGAGLSQGVGLPGWRRLVEEPAARAGVPLGEDLALSAEYLILSGAYSRDQLNEHIRNAIVGVGAAPGEAHEHLARLPVDQIWTTNYDTLLEEACTSSHLVVADDDVTGVGTSQRFIVKMHGSLGAAGWMEPPVVTRGDYENYQSTHPRMWALLRATYLSRTILFLGFSFADPNIGILLQLARTLGTSVGDRHLAVLTRPEPGASDDDRRLHELRVRDLEASGIRVHEIAEHSDLSPLLASLVRRTRPKRLFVAGSFEKADASLGLDTCRAMATQLAARDGWTLISLGGPSGWHVSQQVGQHRRAEGRYAAGQFEFHFRKESRPPERLDERLGAAYYHDRTREELVPWLLEECRASLVIGGGSRTREEIDWARDARVGVVPIGASGGTARSYWESLLLTPPELGERATEPGEWERLGNANLDVAARAAIDLLDRAMYQRPL